MDQKPALPMNIYANAADPNLGKDVLEQYDQLDYHQPTELQVAQIQAIRNLHKTIANELAQMIPNSRERALAFTSLQRSNMDCVKAVVFSKAGV